MISKERVKHVLSGLRVWKLPDEIRELKMISAQIKGDLEAAISGLRQDIQSLQKGCPIIDYDAELGKLEQKIKGVNHSIDMHLLEIREGYERVEEKNSLLTLSNDINQIKQKVSENWDQIHHAITELKSELQTYLAEQRKASLVLRYHNAKRDVDGGSPPAAKVDRILALDEQFRRLEQAAPKAYRLWRPLLDVSEDAYEGYPVDSCSVPGHPTATLFRFFLSPYLRGRVLDIGCGPQPFPTYLEDCPPEAVYGIDPLSEPENHSFHFVKGLGEFLPWADDQFTLVVAATSLDHVLLLNQTFEEVRRVLTKDGIFVAWVGFVPGAAPYDPYSEAVQQLDNYHLFHFDRSWLLEAIAPFFTVLEEFSVDVESHFYALCPREVKSD